METIPKLLSYSKPNVGELKSFQKWIHNRLLDECQGTSRNRRDIWSLSDCNGIRTYNHLVRKRTLNYLMKLTEWVRIPLASNPENSAAVTDVNYSIIHFRSDVPREHHSEDGSMNPVRLKPAIFHSPSPLIMGNE